MTRARIAFPVAYNDDRWLGGVNYTANLVRAILTMPDRKIEPVLITTSDVPDSILAKFPGVERIQSDLIAGFGLPRILAKISERLLGRNLPMEALLKAHGIAAVSHGAPLGARSGIPTISWVPDLQHHHLPAFFSAEERTQRDAAIRKHVSQASVVLLSSYSAQKDLATFAPESAEKSRVLHFVSALGEPGTVEPVETLESRYGFSGVYFHLPNQFWRHKNHKLVVDGLVELRRRGREALVLSTGHTGDHRHPEYFAELQAYLQAAGVADSLRILGVVPYDDMVALMCHSVAVLNPSLFEGWSTTVEEAKSLGKSVLLSDIAVHREQAPTRGSFFSPTSAGELADAMEAALDHHDPAADEARLSEARTALSRRYLEFARAYQDIVLSVLPGREG